ncbi:MAG: restriction endonuclease subunit S [Pseudohongiellaceae bacterium]
MRNTSSVENRHIVAPKSMQSWLNQEVIQPPFAPGDHNVLWLNRCPNSWAFKPIKYLCAINEQVIGENIEPTFEFRYLDIGSVNSDGQWEASEPMSFDDAPSRAKRIVSNEDVLISTVRTYLRAITHISGVDETLICSTGFTVITAKGIVNSKFLAYWIQSSMFVDEIVARSVGVSYPAVNASDIGNLPFPILDSAHQRAIATFLDRETTRIDGLIAKKQRQIELLQEKRSALITHTVTKIDSKTKMKNLRTEQSDEDDEIIQPPFAPSDRKVLWLNRCPNGWEFKPIKYLCTINERVIGKNTEPTFEFRYLDIGNVNSDSQWEASEPMQFYVAPSRARRIVSNGDVLISTVRTYLRAITHISAVDETLICSTGFAVITAKGIVNSKFLAYWVQSSTFVDEIVARSVGVSYPAANASDIGNLPFPILSSGHQRAVATFLDRKTTQIDALVEKIQISIERLREYRIAFISAAITGKINVQEKTV